MYVLRVLRACGCICESTWTYGVSGCDDLSCIRLVLCMTYSGYGLSCVCVTCVVYDLSLCMTCLVYDLSRVWLILCV